MLRIAGTPSHRLDGARRLALALAALSAFGCAPERVAFVGGQVITVDAEDRVVEAFGVEGDRIAIVGSAGEVTAWAEAHGARREPLRGLAVVPGFIDAHGHFPGEGLKALTADLNAPPIGEVTSIETLVSLMSGRAAETDVGEWVVGIGYDDTLLVDQRHPTRDDLDRVSNSHPVAVLHISGHLAAVNSLALERLGYDADTPDPEGGAIRRRAGSRVPDGVLEETAMDPIRAQLLPGLAGLVALVRYASATALAQGVTTAQSGLTDATLMQALDWLTWLGVIPLRIVAYPDFTLGEAWADGAYSPPRWDPNRMRTGPVKLVADGSIQGYTGYLSQPYFVPPGDDPTYRGYPRIARDELFAQVDRIHAAGLQLAIHGNGDAAIDDILDAIEAAQSRTERFDTRHVLIHAQMARVDQLDRMKTLGVVPSFFSLHTFYWGDRHRRIFMGPERAARMSPAASALFRELPFTIHCDAPVVPMEPLRLMWAAVNRRTRSDFAVGPGERISAMEALRAVTATAAWQHFEEHEKGSIEVGKLADFVVLSASPLELPGEIDEISVLETWIGGERVHSAAGAASPATRRRRDSGQNALMGHHRPSVGGAGSIAQIRGPGV